MLKLTLVGLVIAATAIVSLPTNASAHILAIDGDIGAVLHIPPDDSPENGQPTNYVMTFSDSKKHFNLAKCDCKLTVLADDQVVKSGPMGPGTDNVSYTKLTIDNPGVYTLEFSGQPKDGANFQTFTLDYTVRVSDGQLHTQTMPILLWVGLAMAVGLILLAASVPGYN